MNKIIARKSISADLVKFEIRTSIALNEFEVGQYVILRIEKDDQGIPLTVLKTSPENESLTLIVYATDDYSQKLIGLNIGNEVYELEGPFGYQAKIENFGTVLCVGRGSGIAMLLPIITALRKTGNRVITILSSQTQEKIILENEVNALSEKVILHTDDGSIGAKASLCRIMEQTLRENRFNQVFTIGKARIIQETYSLTSKFNVPVQAVLYLGKPVKNGSHGIFRINGGGCAKAVCVDGFNFNAWYPNLEEMVKRFGHEEDFPCKTNVSAEANILI